ncbi:MAG: zinc carboxypeptidase [Bacteroidales bacterium]|nr:zinc carboxypeptidase [Bacteroidales bacterium]
MKRIIVTSALWLLMVVISYSQTVKSPEEFLGYELGSGFTYHHRAVEYFRYVAEVSPLADFREYGVTWEGRPLVVCIVSSEENMKNLEELKKNNLIKTGLAEGSFTGRQVPFIWLGYNIHGNEAAGMETAMKTLYVLVTGGFEGSAEWLKSAVIIIDPCQNPDGRDLYAGRYNSTRSNIANPDKNTWEHNQPWPSARANHYMFDLNRDWVWQTQIESRQRIKLYQEFMPHVFADFHEMGAESSYFFAPGAEPWHEVLTSWQREFHKLTGAGNARMFDERSKPYFTKENFDLFYPGFGDTWPLFNGAMGFTFEQGGGGVSGISYKRENGDTLTLKDRIDGHFIASMATIKVSVENRSRLISEFNKYFEDNQKKPLFQYKSVIIKGDNEKSAMESLFEILDRNRIRYSPAGSAGKKFKGFDYRANTEGEVTIQDDDILISAFQPQSRLMQVLFETDSRANDSVTYDISAWALPYVFNLKAFALKEQIKPDDKKITDKKSPEIQVNEKAYGYVVNFEGFNELRYIAALQKRNIRPRYAVKPFTIDGKNFNRGTVIILRGDNKSAGDRFDYIVSEEARKCRVLIHPVTTGLVESGKDFGSAYSPLMKKKNVAVLCGEGMSSGTVGELWYFFERELEYPVNLINIDLAETIDLSAYDVMILPPGSYSKLKDTITGYVRKGGRVIAIESAVSVFASDKNTALFKAVETRNAELKSQEKKIRSDDTTLLKKYEDERRHLLSERSAGSIYRVRLDETHPYAAGMGKEWFIIKRDQAYPFLDKGSNIAWIPESNPVSGFAGYKFRQNVKNTLIAGSENIGSGEVIYLADDPFFRAYWKSGRILLGNMVLK